MMDLRKDFCDLTTLFGSLAVLFQVYALYNFIITTQGIYTATATTNFMLIGIQEFILLMFYCCVTVMAYTLREKPKTESEKP